MTYALILIIVLTGPAGSVETDASVIDTNLSIEDCREALASQQARAETLKTGQRVETRFTCQTE